ncbi:MAG: hypothetical protein MN733_09655 [Nitrososphaera sp.]|nr:hypothetical protein [Nitrososphaera sp.]
MWATIVGGAGKLVSAVLGFLGSALQYVAIFFAFRLGKRSEQQKQVVEASKVKDEQLEIAARPVEHRDDILDRLRRGGL